jgi:hypothetical protein
MVVILDFEAIYRGELFGKRGFTLHWSDNIAKSRKKLISNLLTSYPTRAFRTRPFRRTRTQTEVRN